MANEWIEFKDLEPTHRQVRKMLDDAAKLPNEPDGPHLDEEEFYRAVSGTLSKHARAMSHLETCRHCANDVAEALHAKDIAQDAAEDDAAVAIEAFSEFEREEWLRVDLPVVAFASAGGFEATRLPTRAVQWQAASSDPNLQCALDDERPDAVVFRLRTRDAAWAERPLRFVIHDRVTGATVADSWIVLHRDPRDVVQYVGHAPVAGASPKTWSAAVAHCEFVATSPPGHQEIGRLRQTIAAASETDRAVWRRWLDQEAAAGRLSERNRAELLARF